jgi:hypothetical protein
MPNIWDYTEPGNISKDLSIEPLWAGGPVRTRGRWGGGRVDFLSHLGVLHTTMQASISRWSAKLMVTIRE